MLNPFRFGTAVSGDEFYDRRDSFRKLYTRLSNGASNVVMYAPRRYGKTSLVKRVLAQLSEEGMPTLCFNLNKIDTLEKFCEHYTAAICSLVGKTAETANLLTTYLMHLHPTVSIGGDALMSVRFDYGEKMSADSLSTVLDFANRVAKDRLGRRIVIAFDEFQEIERLSPNLPMEGVFRSCIQEHDSVGYVFFGSKTHLLKRMFGDRSRPFYKSAANIRLERPPTDESEAYVSRRFAARSIGIDASTASRIVREADNVPYYVQQLGALTFEAVQAREGDWVEETDVESAIEELLAENGDYYSERLSALSPMQRLMVSALAQEPKREFDSVYRKRHSLGASSTVHASLKVLVENGLVESDSDNYYLGDPFFARYVRSRPW